MGVIGLIMITLIGSQLEKLYIRKILARFLGFLVRSLMLNSLMNLKKLQLGSIPKKLKLLYLILKLALKTA